MKKVKTILMSSALLFMVTGCGYNTYLEQNKNPNPEKVEEEKEEEPTKETTNNKTGSYVISVETGFDNGTHEAVIYYNDDNKYYVIDESGKTKYKFTKEGDNFVYRNGYLVESSGDNTWVKDLRTNKKIFEGDKYKKYVDVTEDGHVLVNILKEELSGNSYYSQILDKDGKVVWENENKRASVEYFKVITKNLVIFSPYSYDNYRAINAKTGTETDLKLDGVKSYLDISITGNNVLFGISANNDDYEIINADTAAVTFTDTSHVNQIFNDKYVFARPLWGTVGIYDYNGELVKDLTEGDVQHITYKDGKYYVISNTNFFYVMDESFNYVKEPKKIEEVDGIKNWEFKPYGIVIPNDDLYKTTYIPYDSFNPEKSISSQLKTLDGQIKYYNDKVGLMLTNKTDGNVSGGAYKLINITNLKEIKISK